MSDDVQVDRIYRKLVPTQASRFAIVLESSIGASYLVIYLTLLGIV